MEAYNFFVEFILMTFPIIFATMISSYGICDEFKSVTFYNLFTNSILGSAIVYYIAYYVLEIQMQFFVMVVMCIFLFKASSDLPLTKSIKTVLISLFLNIVIQSIVAFCMILIFKVTFDDIRNMRVYSSIGTLITSIIMSLIGFKLYLIKLKEVKK